MLGPSPVCGRAGLRTQVCMFGGLCPLSHLLVPAGTPSQAHCPPPSDLVILLPPAGCPLRTGPLCSILVGRFGCRATVMLGGVLASLGMVAGSFCCTLGQLYLTAGFITGNCHSMSRIAG